jgi:hypothetical protein
MPGKQVIPVRVVLGWLRSEDGVPQSACVRPSNLKRDCDRMIRRLRRGLRLKDGPGNARAILSVSG